MKKLTYGQTKHLPLMKKIGFNYEHEVEKNEGGTGRLYSKKIK